VLPVDRRRALLGSILYNHWSLDVEFAQGFQPSVAMVSVPPARFHRGLHKQVYVVCCQMARNGNGSQSCGDCSILASVNCALVCGVTERRRHLDWRPRTILIPFF
jgi:hypothetical protein